MIDGRLDPRPAILRPRPGIDPGSGRRLSYPLENALFNWEAGIERLRDLEREGVLRGDQVTVPVRLELRRRLGATFTADQLADLYGSGTDWVTPASRA